MEVYVLDSLLRRETVVDKFESLIWTERFSEIGDFELLVNSTRETRGQFLTGTRLAVNTSYRVMTVETIEDTIDADGKKILKVKGRSLEALLEDRIARGSHAELDVEPTWNLSGLPADIARTVFQRICVDGLLSLDDVIPFMTAGNIMPNDTLAEPSTPITVEIPPQTVFESIKNLCDIYDLGFRLIRNFDMSQLYFNIYAGSDRTTRQSALTPVIFAVENDNLQNTTELENAEEAKNVAYVYSDFGSAIVFGDGVPPDVEGFDRRVLLVEVTDIDATTPDVPGVLQQRGKEELSKHRVFSAFDGEINQRGSYRYGVDYNLGDIVEMRNQDGIITYKRVTEQIFVHDIEGERNYPTVSMDKFISANTWRSQLGTRVWADYGSYPDYILAAWNAGVDVVSLPTGVTLTKTNAINHLWVTNTTDTRALQGPDGTRNASAWYNGGSFSATLTFTTAWVGSLRLYALDWDSTTRRETIKVTDRLGTQTYDIKESFNQGLWMSFPVDVAANGTIKIDVTLTAGPNAVLSGLFLGPAMSGSTWADQ